CARRSISYQLIADPAQRLEQRFGRIGLEFGAQAAHVDVQQIVVRQTGPDSFRDVRAGQGAPRVLHEDFEQREFPAGEIDVLVPQLDRVTQQIHAYAAMGDHGLLYRRLAPQQGTYVGEQFIEAEGLGQVIVGAEVETLDAILHRVARAEDEHGLVEAGAAPFREQVQAVAV